MFRVTILLGLSLVFLFGTGQSGGELPGRRLLTEAQLLLDSARYDEALQQVQRALASFPDRAPETGECLLLLGNVFLEKGEWDAAGQQYNAALSIFLKKPGPKHLLTAQAYNNLGEYFYKKANYAQAEIQYRKALDIRKAAVGPAHALVADSYNNLGNCRVATGDYATATALHEKALAIRQKTLPAGHPDLAVSFSNLGNCAYLSGNYPLALEQFEKALTIREKTFGPDHPKTAQALNNLGNAFSVLGRREKAVTLYRQALDIRKRHLGERHPAVAGALENIADLHFDNGDHIAALDYYRQAYAIQRQVQGEQSPAAASLWHKIGLCYQYEGDFTQALQHHQAAEPVLTAAFGPAHPFIAGLFINLGNCYSGKKDFDRAIGFYERALSVFQQTQGGQHVNIALVYNNLGTTNLKLNRATQALFFFNKATESLRTGQIDAHPENAVYLKNTGLALERLDRWPDTRAVFRQALDAARMADPITGTEVLSAWGAALCRRGIRMNDPVLLRQSIAVLDTALRRSDSLRAALSAPASRQRWIETQYPTLMNALEACHRLWAMTRESAWPEQAFALAERYKSLQLLEHLRHEHAERFAGIPDSLLEQERVLGEALNLQEKQRLSWLIQKDTLRAQQAETDIAETRQALADLIRDFETRYPAYYRLRYHWQTATPKTVQQQVLQSDQALLEYVVSDSAIFVFVIASDQFHFLRLARHFPLDEWVAALRHSLQAYPEAAGTAAAELAHTYTDLAFRLYETIVAPVQAAVPLPKKWIIAPDGALAYLPFECLLRERPADFSRFKSHRYLVRDYQISYAYSATQQAELLQKPAQSAGKGLFAVAPSYDNSPFGLRPLQHNRPEVRAVQALFGGDLLEGPAATVPAFLREAARYRVLLLATHGQAGSSVGDLSYLAFSGTDSTVSPFLYARDLYHLSLPADMVVLSACETSVGEYRLGQGVISLAKGFFHAGARSVVATLWSVDDAKNAELIRLFFQQIKAGSSKDEALRRAKLDFLQTHAHDEAHPVYWAAVTAYGDMQAIDFQEFNWWWVVAAGAVVLVGFGFMVRRNYWRNKKAVG